MSVAIPVALRPLLRPLADLTEYPQNAQQHDPADVEKFVQVLQQFGWTQPIVAWRKNNDGKLYISAGHLRYRAAVKAGLTEAPVLVREDWDERQFRAYTIADNAWTKRAAWDVPLLRDELVALDDGQFDLSVTGFDRQQIFAMVHWGIEQDDYEKYQQGLPEYEQKNILNSTYRCLVRFRSPEDIPTFEKLLGIKLLKPWRYGRVYTAWFPQVDLDSDGRDLAFESES